MSDVQEILSALQIEVVGESENRKTGALEFKARCPYHHDGSRYDRNPGWYINEETGAHICFSCGFTGGLEVLAYRVLDVTWEEAVAWVGNRTDILARFAERDAWAKEDRGPRQALAPINEARLLAFDDPPRDALRARLLDQDSAAAYEVRWDTRKDAWILPIRSADGHLLGWQVKGAAKGSHLFRNFPIGVQKGSTLFGLQTITGTEEVGVIESPLDAVRLHSIGLEATSTFGATVTETQMELLISRCPRLLFAMDNPHLDDAGRRSSLWILGLDKTGKPLRNSQDYTKRIPTRFFHYTPESPKDVGDMTAPQIRTGQRDARSSVWGAKAVA